MEKALSISEFLKMAKNHLVVDVRSPIEHEKGRLPNSINLPLLSDEHRKIIGKLYKQEGRQAAVLKGFELVGPLFAEKAKELLALSKNNKIGIYCWRGGMRTEIMTWIARLAGISVFTLKGGYKSFRNEMLKTNAAPLKNGFIISGQTGSGKTEILINLAKLGYKVIDLEAAASHKGSSFGGIGLPVQSQEMFENLIAFERYNTEHESKEFWLLEDESRLIGQKCIPNVLYESMQELPLIELMVPIEERTNRLVKEYGGLDKTELEEATLRLKKKLGDEQARFAVSLLHENKLNEWVKILLTYYDKTYNHSRNKKNKKSHQINYSWQAEAESFENLQLLIKKLTNERSQKTHTIQ
jgi:tRNA 2-selenouridine synthase